VSDTGTGYFSGYVGIGTSTPGYSMHILESSPGIRLEESGSTILDISVGASVDFRRQSNAAPFTFTQGSTEALRIDTGGNVGIGTTSPNRPLEVNGYVRGTGYDLGAVSVLYNSGSDLIVNNTNSANTLFTLSGVEMMRVDHTGNIGVNNSFPSEKLDIATGNVRVTGGQAYSTVYNAGSSTSIDWNNGNVQYTSAAPPTTITFSNMKDGGSYTLLATSTTAGVFTFNDSASSLTFRFQPSNGSTASNKETVYTFIRVGTKVYVSWITGF
jgi:hypothetical protein